MHAEQKSKVYIIQVDVSEDMYGMIIVMYTIKSRKFFSLHD